MDKTEDTSPHAVTLSTRRGVAEFGFAGLLISEFCLLSSCLA
jgi:hypothetical protein